MLHALVVEPNNESSDSLSHKLFQMSADLISVESISSLHNARNVINDNTANLMFIHSALIDELLPSCKTLTENRQLEIVIIHDLKNKAHFFILKSFYVDC